MRRRPRRQRSKFPIFVRLVRLNLRLLFRQHRLDAPLEHLLDAMEVTDQFLEGPLARGQPPREHLFGKTRDQTPHIQSLVAQPDQQPEMRLAPFRGLR